MANSKHITRARIADAINSGVVMTEYETGQVVDAVLAVMVEGVRASLQESDPPVKSPEQTEPDQGAVGPAMPYFWQIMSEEEEFRDNMDSFPPALLGDPDAELPAEVTVRMLQVRDCLNTANAVLRKIVGDGALVEPETANQGLGKIEGGAS